MEEVPGIKASDPSSYCRLKFWGVRGSIPTPGPETIYYGGNTSCVEIRADGELIILDAGTGIRPLGMVLAEEFKNRALDATILISHTHWDHIQGFPFFYPAYTPGNHLKIVGFEGAPSTLRHILSNQMATPYFPVALEELKGAIEVKELEELSFHVGRVKVYAATLNHPGLAAGYRLETSRGSIAYLPDHEPSGCGAEIGVPDAECEALARELDRHIVDFVRGVDVLVIDSQYDDEEYSRHIGWGHGCVSVAVKTAVEANVKRLFLFHHDPNHSDAQVSYLLHRARRLAASLGSSIIVDAAREGEQVEL
jgi:phosphoribosyl 1,2-cyclic phosphodiesterase